MEYKNRNLVDNKHSYDKVVFIYSYEYIKANIEQLDFILTNRYPIYILETNGINTRSIPKEIKEKHDIHIINHDIHIMNTIYTDNENISNDDILLNFALCMKKKGKIPFIITRNTKTILSALFLGICVNPNNDLGFNTIKKNIFANSFSTNYKTHLFFTFSHIKDDYLNFKYYICHTDYVKVIFSNFMEDLINDEYIDTFYLLAFLISTREDFKFCITPSKSSKSSNSSSDNIVINHAIKKSETIKGDCYIYISKRIIDISKSTDIFSIFRYKIALYSQFHKRDVYQNIN